MARYLEVAAEANVAVLKILDMLPEEQRPAAAEMLARIVNYAVRSCPRGVQHTVRLNIVRAAMNNAPVRVGMVEKKDEKTGRTYHALTTIPVGGKMSVEAGDNED